jgi:hypothetical protein
MSAAGMYNKIIELEQKLLKLDVSGSTPNSDERFNTINIKLTDLENKSMPPDLPSRVSAIESNNLLNRVNDLENKYMPPDLPSRVSAIESNNLLNRVNDLENKSMPPDLPSRIEAIESNNLLNRIVDLENKHMPPDLTIRVSAIEAILAEFNSLNLKDIREKINNYENTISNLKQAIIVLDDQVESLKNK